MSIQTDHTPLLPNDATGSNSTWMKRWKYYFPIAGWLPRYPLADLPHDLIGGLSVAVMIVPQGIAYSFLAGVDPIVMLRTGFYPLIAFAFFTSSRHMAVGPESGSAILVGQALAQYSDEDKQSVAAAIALVIGCLLLLMGIFRMGFVSSLLSRSALISIVISLASVLIIEQLPKLFGTTSPSEDEVPIAKLYKFLVSSEETNGATAGMGLSSLFILLSMKKLREVFSTSVLLAVVPAVLIVVVYGILISWYVGLEGKGVEVLGHLATGLVKPELPSFGNSASSIFQSAVLIGLLGFTNSMIVVKKYAEKYKYNSSANRELIALGIANIISSTFGGICAFGSYPRTKVSEAAGVRSPIATLIASIFVLLTIFFLLPPFRYLPKAIGASIITYAAIGMILDSFKDISSLVGMRQYADILVASCVYTATIFLGVDSGVLVALGSCLLLALKQTTIPSIHLIGKSETGDWQNVEDMNRAPVAGALVLRLDGPLYFANADKLRDSLRRIEEHGQIHAHPSETEGHTAIKFTIFEMTNTTALDSTGALVLLDIIQAYRFRKIPVVLVGLSTEGELILDRVGVFHPSVLDKDEACFNHLEQAISTLIHAEEGKDVKRAFPLPRNGALTPIVTETDSSPIIDGIVGSRKPSMDSQEVSPKGKAAALVNRIRAQPRSPLPRSPSQRQLSSPRSARARALPPPPAGTAAAAAAAAAGSGGRSVSPQMRTASLIDSDDDD